MLVVISRDWLLKNVKVERGDANRQYTVRSLYHT
jgi:hypothetical protein